MQKETSETSDMNEVSEACWAWMVFLGRERHRERDSAREREREEKEKHKERQRDEEMRRFGCESRKKKSKNPCVWCGRKKVTKETTN